ncbi:MAG: hypothetical protein KH234_10115, partial [Subdoligranulum variabile]|nr:hypothetical protein [Subdoligranulum variabile]
RTLYRVINCQKQQMFIDTFLKSVQFCREPLTVADEQTGKNRETGYGGKFRRGEGTPPYARV